MLWAVSQAAPMRRMIVEGNLDLYQYVPPYVEAGYASGGFIADMTVNGVISSGSQQQFIARNVDMAQWMNGVWNIVMVGSENTPKPHCGLEGGSPYTIVDETPIIVEKPYIAIENGKYSLMVPKVEKNKKGPTAGFDNADEIPFENVYVAGDDDCADNCLAKTINEKLAAGLNVVLQPGIYHLEDTIVIDKADTVVFGMGLATVIAPANKPAIKVGNVDGVKVSGILLQANKDKAPTLLQWGEKGYAGTAENPGAMHDVFARVGGPDHFETHSELMIQINSGNVIIDDTWLWRADHNVDGAVIDSKNDVRTGLEINGDDVYGYGLAVEHTLGHLLEWNGENGHTYFY